MFGERLSFSMVTQPVKMDLIQSASRPEAKSGRNTLNFSAAILIVEVDGGTSGDTIRGQDDDDSLNGLDGADTIYGRAGSDSLMGAGGNDELKGGSGADSFDAAEGADRIEAADNEADQIDCGSGNDTVFFDELLDTFVDITACEDRRAV
jgi:Ca2+-binding RTX toxin-like protein